MRKYIPYIIAVMVVGALVALVLNGHQRQQKKIFDQRITLLKQDKIPYGTYAAFHLLKTLVPTSTVITSRKEPGYWDSVNTSADKQAYVFIGHRFTADAYEMKNLARFAEKGNTIFISASYFSEEANKFINANTTSLANAYFEADDIADSLITFLSPPFIAANKKYSYPGLTHHTYFSRIDAKVTEVLGTNDADKPIFIHLAIGKGHLYFHLEPLAFSNYFLLYKNNIDYLEKALSVIPPHTNKVIWDEYYAAKTSRSTTKRNNRQGWFKALMTMENAAGERSFKWAFLLLLFLLVVYVLMEMRRKQRYIPVIKPPKNDSLDFVKTIGRLYYDKGNHANLCRKMTAYFLEYVRSTYKIPTTHLNDTFVTTLQYKSGVPAQDIQSIISFIQFIEVGGEVSKEHLLLYHRELTQFYNQA
ncbi:MAG: hypothetical protein RIR12_300 [Bacteroidota bacterium]